MRQYFKIIIILVLVIGTFFLAVLFVGKDFFSKISPDIQVVDQGTNTSQSIETGKEMPYFELPTISGQKISSIDLKGFPTIITFWSTWSSDSIDQIKIMDDYMESISSNQSNLHIIAINSQEQKDTVASFMKRGGYKIEVLLDTKGEESNVFGVKTLPTSLFFDNKGNLEEVFVGVMNKDLLVDKIGNIIK
jgi:peroxiredoxin